MANRTRYIIQRLIFSLIAFWAVATVIFLMFRLIPGDPTIALLPQGASESAKEQLRQQFGLDEPLYVQYSLFLKNLVVGDLGVSFVQGEPVTSIVFDRTLNTIALFLPAILISFTIGPLIGSVLSWYRGTKIDTWGIGLVLIMRGAPVFWTGMIAIMFFSFRFGWLPSGQMHSAGFTADGIVDRFFNKDFLWHLVLPLSVVTLYLISIPTFIMRNTMIDVLNEDFIELLEAEGLSERRILFLHATRNSLLPILHYFALSTGVLFGGSVVIETVFSWPGVGMTMWEALQARDYPLVQGTFLMVAFVVILLNFVADFISVYIDPRAAETGE